MVEKNYGVMKELKVGKYVLIDDVPCKIVDIQSSAPGKHGAAKIRVSAIGIFDGQKRSLLKPADADVEIPIITRKTAQIISISGDSAQLMDLASYELFEIQIPEEIRKDVEAGKEAEYMETMGKRAIIRVVKRD